MPVFSNTSLLPTGGLSRCRLASIHVWNWNALKREWRCMVVLNLVFASAVQATDEDGSELVRQTAVRVGVRLLFFEGPCRRLECRVPADHGLRRRGTSIRLVRYCGVD